MHLDKRFDISPLLWIVLSDYVANDFVNGAMTKE